ncbi:MAG: PAS domain S-box protein [Breznakibacter sp.]
MKFQELVNKRILLVGTDEEASAEIEKALNQAGCTVTYNAEMGMASEILQKEHFDALLFEMEIAPDIDGCARRNFKIAKHHNIPAILLTIKTRSTPLEETLLMKADDYLPYPWDMEALSFKLAMHFRLREEIAVIREEAARRVDIYTETIFKIAKNIPLPFAITEKQGKIRFINPKFTELFGFEKEEIPSIEVWFKKTYTNPVLRKIAYNQWKKLQLRETSDTISKKGENEYILFSKDGARHMVEIYLEKSETLNYIIFNDITKEKKDLQEIKKLSEAIYQNPASIVITDHRGIITFVNPKYTEITGYLPEEVIGRNPRIQQSGLVEPAIYNELWSTLASGRTWHGEFINKKKNGETYWERATIAPILNENGTVAHYIAIKEDITDKRKAMEELVRSEQALQEANATKDKFFSIIAHDLRNPIGSIKSLAEILIKQATLDEDQHQFIHHIQTLSANTLALLEDLLNWAQSQSGLLNCHPQYFNVSQQIDQAKESLKDLAIQKNITLTVLMQHDVQAYGDTKLFQTIVRNLISNAVKFTHEGGIITIQNQTTEDAIKITIADNGVGIAADRIPVLFHVEKNYSTPGTANETGTGMGLPLCKEFVTKMGGEIWIESQPGKGTYINFTIPSNLQTTTELST